MVDLNALLNHGLRLHHCLCLLLDVTPCTRKSLGGAVLKGSHQMLQTGGKQTLLNKGMFDPGLEKGFKSLPRLLPDLWLRYS